MASTHLPPDRERLTAWVHDHGPAILGFLMASVRDRHTADDLLQEVFCRAWEARDRYVDQGKQRAYLLRIADRLVCDRARRGGRESVLDGAAWQAIEPADTRHSPEHALTSLEGRRQLDEALATLSEAQRRTLLLRYYGDLDFSEIAATLDCPVNTVLSHARRGLSALRRLLAEHA